MSPGPVLVLFAHPALQKSRANVPMLEAIAGLEDVTVHDLYEAYPRFHIHVEHEQELLRRHQTIVFQHPFYWYSSPPLLKQWEDLVLSYQWAYGPEGTALQGKRALSALTTGGRAEAYARTGINHYTMAEFLRPFEQTARLCNMRWLPPFVIHAAGRIEPSELRERYAAAYRRLLIALRDDTLDEAALAGQDYINGAVDVDTGL